MSFYIGLMSGTSMDGIDAVLVEIAEDNLSVINSCTFPYAEELRRRLTDAINPSFTASLHELATLDMDVAAAFATASLELLNQAQMETASVEAIGSHGQTLRHSPTTTPPYSLQIGNGPAIAAQTSINTVNDFRGIDVAAGGEGAPLVPAFHEWLFRKEGVDRVVLNIGGIANITVLPGEPGASISGFDTGPGNCLMDEWYQRHQGQPYDRGGEWAESGTVSEVLLEELLRDPYFEQTMPKSTGREYFNAEWLEHRLQQAACQDLLPVDVQATLLALSATSISEQISASAPANSEVVVCGGGAFNHLLMARLQHHLPNSTITSTAAYDVDPEMIEAVSFAWFAYNRVNNTPVKLTTRKTSNALVLGGLHIAPRSGSD